MLTDHLGTVRDLVNNNGGVVNHFTYDSFGKVLSASGTVDTRYKFTGREFDQETGLYYYRARYFDANVGRFIGQDPIGFNAGDSNLYRYVGNKSINHTDPTGLYGVVKPGTWRRKIKYVLNAIQLKETWHIENVPHNGSARIYEDITTAVIIHSPTNRPRSNKLPIPWGGRRPGPYGDDSGHIVGHALGGSDTDRNNFFAHHWYRNRNDFRNFESRVSNKLEPDSFERCRPSIWPFAAYFVQLHYSQYIDPKYPLRPEALSAVAAFVPSLSRNPEKIYLDNPK
jgi:RHS repeat-associated protein